MTSNDEIRLQKKKLRESQELILSRKVITPTRFTYDDKPNNIIVDELSEEDDEEDYEIPIERNERVESSWWEDLDFERFLIIGMFSGLTIFLFLFLFSSGINNEESLIIDEQKIIIINGTESSEFVEVIKEPVPQEDITFDKLFIDLWAKLNVKIEGIPLYLWMLIPIIVWKVLKPRRRSKW